MKSLRLACLFLIAWFGWASSALGAPALWRVADSDTTLYLFGTIHIMEKDVQWLSPAASKAFDEAAALIVELDEAELQKAGPLFVAAGRLPQGMSLRTTIGNGLYNDVERISKQLGVPVANFAQARPWFTAMSLNIGALIRAGYDPASGADKTLLAMAAASGKPVVPLESAAFQADLFGTLPVEAEKALLLETLKEIGQVKQMFGDMQAAWLNGDPDRLADAMNASFEASPGLAERLLLDRNRDWQGKMMQLLDKPGTFFVAVGAGHLAGEGSLVALIRAEGIPVNRVE